MKPKKTKKQEEIIKAWNERDKNIPSDVLGSYTGNPSSAKSSSPYEKPTQDGDDI